MLKLFAGHFSDRLGKRKGFVVFGYALSSFARPLLAFAANWYQVFVIRVGDRVGKGIRSAPRDAMIADTVTLQERGLAFGLHRAMDHTGAVIGPLIGYVVLVYFAANQMGPAARDFRTIFLVASVPALASVVVVTVCVRESAIQVRPTETAATPPVPIG